MSELEIMKILNIEQELKSIKELLQYNSALTIGILKGLGASKEEINSILDDTDVVIERCKDE